MTDIGVANLVPGRLPAVYLVVIEAGEGGEAEITAYRDQVSAETAARRIVEERTPPPNRLHLSTWAGLQELSELTDEMRADGWTFNAAYSLEGDYVRVQRVEIR